MSHKMNIKHLFKRNRGTREALSRGFPVFDERPVLNNKIVVGTHHKTGTVWLRDIFTTFCRRLGLNFFKGHQHDLPADFDVFLQNHSMFTLDAFTMPYRGVHIIRDPRDRIVSGAFYHQKSAERWLHAKRENFGGMTYQEKICSLPTFEEKLTFEMENSAFQTISDMTSWDYTNENFIEIQYEDLIQDTDLMLFHRIFTYLGIDGRAIPEALKIAWENSLFSGNLKNSVHIRSGRSKQWEEHFTPRLRRHFVELYDDALIVLGYEENNDWACV